MNDNRQLLLSEREREIILRGLRYVRSALALEMIDPTPETVAQRRREMSEVAALSDLISRSERTAATIG